QDSSFSEIIGSAPTGSEGTLHLTKLQPGKASSVFLTPRNVIPSRRHRGAVGDDPGPYSALLSTFPMAPSHRTLLRHPLTTVDKLAGRVQVPRVTGRLRDQVKQDVLQFGNLPLSPPVVALRRWRVERGTHNDLVGALYFISVEIEDFLARLAGPDFPLSIVVQGVNFEVVE